MSETACCQCQSRGPLVQLYGYTFCEHCQSKLGLHTDETIQKNAELHAAMHECTYQDETVNRLQTMEQDFIKKKIKLLHILDRLDSLDWHV